MASEYSSYLAHHGIKGQKWGVRRFQNEDGSLKQDGKKQLNLRRRLTHDKKELILKKAVEKNTEKIKIYDQEHKEWKEEEGRVKRLKNEYVKKANYEQDLAFARNQAKLSKNRVDAWLRREKRLTTMKIDDMSVRQVKKATKLRWHEYAYPDE